MRGLAVAFATAAVLVVAVAPTSPALGAAKYVKCSGGYNPDGSPGLFYQRIRAKRVTCPNARKVVKAWVVAHADGSKNPTSKVRISGYSCTGKSVSQPGDPNGGLEVLCRRDGGRKAVRFYGHP